MMVTKPDSNRVLVAPLPCTLWAWRNMTTPLHVMRHAHSSGHEIIVATLDTTWFLHSTHFLYPESLIHPERVVDGTKLRDRDFTYPFENLLR